MIRKLVDIIVIIFFLSIFVSNLKAASTLANNESEQIKLFEKAIQQDPDLATVTSWFGPPDFLVKRYNAGIKKAESVWIENQKTIQKIQDLGATQTLEVLPLVDWHTSNEQLIGESGFSYLIKTDQSTILFDTGFNGKQSDPSPLLHNMKQLGVGIDSIDVIVISHNHIDHVGGRRWQEQRTFSLGNEQIDLGVKKVFTPIPMTYPGLSPICTESPTKISSGVTTIGVITNQLFFSGMTSEQAIAVNVLNKGIVLIVGGGHQTMGKLLKQTEALFDTPIYGMIGGLYYLVSDSRMIINGVKVHKYFGTGKPPWESLTLKDVKNDINLLKNKKPGIVAISTHVSSDASINEFRKIFRDNYRDVKVGETIVVGNR